MGVKRRLYDVLHSVVVVGLVVDAIWRWRKIVYWAIAGFVVYRVLLLGAVIAIVFSALMPGRALADIPGGRDPGMWYFCHAQRSSSTSGAFTGDYGPLTCEIVLFQAEAGGGGAYDSVLMEASVVAVGGGSGSMAQLRGYVLPARGIKSFTYRCTGGSAKTITAAAFGTTAVANAAVQAAWFTTDSSTWTVSAASPVWPGTPSSSATINTVSTFRALTDDKFWTEDPSVSWDGASPSGKGVRFEAAAANSNGNSGTSANFSCQILTWLSWASWLGSNPEWTPGPGAIVVGPTPTPETIWEAVPWVPITDSVYTPIFNLGPGEDGGCTMLIPEQSIEIGGNQYGWYGFEMCRTDFSLGLSIFNEDVNYWLNVALSVGGLAIVWSIIKRA